MDDQPEPASEPGDPHQRRSGLLAAIILLASITCATAAEPDPPYLQLELKMFGLINGDRAKHKRKPLRYDNALAAVARAHSADMLENGFFNHKSPTTGLVGDRLFVAKEIVMGSGENIAMFDTIDGAQAKLMTSPGHRKNILGKSFTHCGVGIVQGANGIYYITQVFAMRPRPVDPKTLGPKVVALLNKVRGARGKRPFNSSGELDRVAAAHVAKVAEAGKPVAVDIRAEAAAAGIKAGRISTGLVSTWNPGEVASAAAFLKPGKGRIGIGVARNEKHKDLGYGVIWIFVVFTDE